MYRRKWLVALLVTFSCVPILSFLALPGGLWCQQVWRERPVILLAIVAVMGLIELTVGREDYGSSEAEPGKLGEFWQAARPADPQVHKSTMQ